jgi:hypothetical protein
MVTILLFSTVNSWLSGIEASAVLILSYTKFGIEPSGSMKCWETIEWPNI